MAQSPLVHSLVEKRREISGAISALERQIVQKRRDLLHLDATIRMFAPELNLQVIRPKAPAKPRLAVFLNGEISRRVREAIRASNGEPVSADDIAVRAMTDKGLNPDDRKLRSDFIRRFLWALARMDQAGTVQRIGHGIGARWVLPQETTEAAQ